MKSTIRKVLKEMASERLKNKLIAMGPKGAEEKIGIEIEDFINIAYDGDIVEYVSEFINPLTLLRPSGNNAYDYNGSGPLAGLVFRYVGRYKTRNGEIVKPYAIIPQTKLNYLIIDMGLLTEEMFLEFLNEFYYLNMTRIVPKPTTNFG